MVLVVQTTDLDKLTNYWLETDEYIVFTVTQQKKIIKNSSVDKVKKLCCCSRQVKKKFLHVLRLYVFLNSGYLSECLAQIYSSVWSRHVGGAPSSTMVAGNSVNIWNLLWQSKRLIIWTEKANIYTSTFPNTLTPKNTTNHKISASFSANAIGVVHALP